MGAAEVLDDPIFSIASRLCGRRVDRIEQMRGGRNSRVWRLDAGGRSFALKQYPTDDPRDRLAAERDALNLMESAGIASVPRFVNAEESGGFSMLSWVDGTAVREIWASDIDQAISLLRAIKPLTDFDATRLAAEACLSTVEIERQLLARLTRLRGVTDSTDLHRFLDRRFDPFLTRVLAAIRPDFVDDLPEGQRRLVPSDFGFHNTLRGPNGHLSFIDFEYFGWDDPAKLVADFLLHPGMNLPDVLRRRFRTAAVALYGDDPGFANRLRLHYPLFGLRWVLILLNEFLPEVRCRRRLAGAEPELARQLTKAAGLLERIAGSPI